MSTRSGRSYKESGSVQPEKMSEERIEGLMRVLLEDRKSRDAQFEEERQRQQRVVEEERLRQQRVAEEEKALMREQMEMLTRLVGESRQVEETRTNVSQGSKEGEAKLVKLTVQDDIESYLVTFERVMRAYEVKENRWAVKLAPQLTGKAQQAYAAMRAEDAGTYQLLKEAILRRYDISDETYRQRFRETVKKEDETVSELAVRLDDLLQKWTKDCKTVAEVRDLMVREQLLNALPRDLKIWVSERKPKTSTEAADMADNYVRARKQERDPEVKRESRRENTGMKPWPRGQRDSERRSGLPSTVPSERGKYTSGRKETLDREGVTCFNCGKKGHISRHCPNNVLVCAHVGWRNGLQRSGTVNGRRVEGIMLDTGCSRTMVHSDLVSDGQIREGESAVVRCANGDTAMYPMADICVELDGYTIDTVAAVSDTLPMDVLLRTDVPELGMLLSQASERAEVFMATTRAQAKKEAKAERDSLVKELRSGVRPNPILLDEPQEETWNLGEELDDTIFHGGREKLVQSRSQKREGRRIHRAKVCSDPPVCMQNTQDISAEELRILQETDPTLGVVRKAVDKKESTSGVSFVIKDGLMYRVVVMLLGGDSEPYARDQLVLPSQCRSVVMELAHSIPLAGHLGKNKTTDRVLQRFYWPTLRKDVADFCKRQKTSRVKPQHAPLIPLPIVEEPFQRIAMDIVGPLPRSSSGNRYILVVCDYATRYPEAMPMWAVDAEAVAEELVKMFTRVGIPREILTDQGSNFTSQLLAELYRLLHIRPIRTSPYHPQTDGLVERFNQTLKSMLRKVATQEGEAWDKLIPYVLFAYREVPQSSTGFSPFELLYGREVRGPLDVLQESWVAKEKSSENVVSHIMSIREKMAEMTTIVRESLEKAQASQKSWYDQNARMRTLNEGAMVLVLLPTSSSALTAQWQGPYKVVKQVGKVNYLIDMHNRRKRKRVFHINMLREFLSNSSAVCTSYWSENLDVDEDDEIPVWNGSRAGTGAEDSPQFGPHLTKAQRDELDALLCELSAVMSNSPGKTNWTEHRIETGSARSVRLPPYRIPHAYREKVEMEIQEMLEGGIITPSNSEWSSPVVLVKKKVGSLRLCVDYRRLNSVSESDAYPMPRIDDLIDRLGEARFISTLDLTRGYWQVTVAEEARHKTAFATPFGLYEFTVMPFGLQGAPATFQRLMDRIVKGCESFAAAYLDDLIIFTFRQLKTQLCCYPVLRSPDFNKEFVLQTDASNRGIGAVLSQRDAAGGENPIAYFSKKLLPREERYSTIEKECLAIKLGMEAFRTYLLGRPFIVETDHRSLVWMDKLKDHNSRLTRWSLSLQPYNFSVAHRTGASNGNADALSRSTWPEDAASDIAAGEEERDVRDCELSGARGIGRVY
ncbi:hypothetical protein EMCRGX_G018260 [Ephydatia muelleri]